MSSSRAKLVIEAATGASGSVSGGAGSCVGAASSRDGLTVGFDGWGGDAASGVLWGELVSDGSHVDATVGIELNKLELNSYNLVNMRVRRGP